MSRLFVCLLRSLLWLTCACVPECVHACACVRLWVCVCASTMESTNEICYVNGSLRRSANWQWNIMTDDYDWMANCNCNCNECIHTHTPSTHMNTKYSFRLTYVDCQPYVICMFCVDDYVDSACKCVWVWVWFTAIKWIVSIVATQLWFLHFAVTTIIHCY